MQWKRNLYILSVGTFIAQATFTLVTPFLPIYLLELGLRRNVSVWSGLVLSIASVTFGIMAPVWGSLSDRYGKRVMLVRSGLGIALTMGFTAFVRDHIQLFVLRGLNGLVSGYIPAAIILIASNTPEAELGYALGVVQTTGAIGGIIGPLLGGIVVELLGIRGTLLFGAGMMAVCASLPFLGVKERFTKPENPTTVLAATRQVLGNKSLRILFTIILLSQAALLAIQPTLPLLIAQLVRSRAAAVTGLMFSLVGISTAVGAPLIGRIHKTRYQETFQMGLMAAAVISMLQGLLLSVVVLGSLRFIFGFANAAIMVVSNVFVAQSTEREARGRAFGVLNGIGAAGSVLGLLLGGFLGDRLGLVSPFYGSAVLYAVAAGLAALSARSIVFAEEGEICGRHGSSGS